MERSGGGQVVTFFYGIMVDPEFQTNLSKTRPFNIRINRPYRKNVKSAPKNSLHLGTARELPVSLENPLQQIIPTPTTTSILPLVPYVPVKNRWMLSIWGRYGSLFGQVCQVRETGYDIVKQQPWLVPSLFSKAPLFRWPPSCSRHIPETD